MKTELLAQLGRIHTTSMGEDRIRKNLFLSSDTDVVLWCKEKIKNAKHIESRGKNFYAYVDDIVFTVNKNSFTIITAHKKNEHN